MTSFTATARLQHLAAVAIIGVSISATSAPALAAEKAQTDAKIASTAAAAAAVADRSEKRYCKMDTPPGSRLPRKICKTATEWELAGQDLVRR